MVGYLERTLQDPHSRRAVLWSDVANPVDLNTRLYRAPAGLVLYAANAINDDGTIVADSSAGLVLLRPGKKARPRRYSAPSLAHPPATWSQRAPRSTSPPASSTAPWPSRTWHPPASTMACPQAAPSLRERRGAGDVSLRHTFCKAGAFTVRVKVTDRAGNATQVQRRVTVN